MVDHWNSDGGTEWWNSGKVRVEQCCRNGGRVIVEQSNGVNGTVKQFSWNSGTVMVEQCGPTVEQ